MKYNVALFVDTKRLEGLNLDHLYEGNPGTGGMEYITLVLACLLSEESQFSVTLYNSLELNLPFKNLKQITTCSVQDSLINFSKNNDSGILIATPRDLESLKIINKIKNIKVITWEHCFFSNKMNKIIGKTKNIIANVVLSKSVLEEKYCYFNLYKKSFVIGNFTQTNHCSRNNENIIQNHKVAFVGTLLPIKGFEIVTKIWPWVVKKVPDAHLYVFGSSLLYFKNSNSGKYHLSNEKYEKEFLYPLLKNDLMETVTFKGAIDNRLLYDELKEMKVGLAGIKGVSETFCISAADFGSVGIPTIGRNVHAIKDTIPNGSGYRFNNKRQLRKMIVQLLIDVDTNKLFGENYKKYVSNNFSLNVFKNNWVNLLSGCFQGQQNIKQKINVFKYLACIIKNNMLAVKFILEEFLNKVSKRLIRNSKTIKEKY